MARGHTHTRRSRRGWGRAGGSPGCRRDFNRWAKDVAGIPQNERINEERGGGGVGECRVGRQALATEVRSRRPQMCTWVHPGRSTPLGGLSGHAREPFKILKGKK